MQRKWRLRTRAERDRAISRIAFIDWLKMHSLSQLFFNIGILIGTSFFHLECIEQRTLYVEENTYSEVANQE